MGKVESHCHGFQDIAFSYSINDLKLIDQIENELLLSLVNLKIGIITDNIDYFEVVNIEREKRLITSILNELKEDDYHWII